MVKAKRGSSNHQRGLKSFNKRSSKVFKLGNVKIYNKKINSKAKNTFHFENERSYRELFLKRKLGSGSPVGSFTIDSEENGKQIHEVLDNAVIYVYSFETHEKITVFAATPSRISSLYKYAGILAPVWLLNKAEENCKNEYNLI